MFPELDLHYADPAQPLTMAGDESDDLDHDLSETYNPCYSRGVTLVIRVAIEAELNVMVRPWKAGNYLRNR